MRLYMEGWTVDMGHSLPTHSAPIPTNVRYASDSDRLGHGSERTRNAMTGHRPLAGQISDTVAAPELRVAVRMFGQRADSVKQTAVD